MISRYIYIYTHVQRSRDGKERVDLNRECKYNSLFFFERVNFAGRCRFRESSEISTANSKHRIFFSPKDLLNGDDYTYAKSWPLPRVINRLARRV